MEYRPGGQSIANKPDDALTMDITYTLLEQITNGFSEEHKVGSGGFGEVYKGVHNGEEIAVKKLYNNITGINDVQFKSEFNSLMRVQHRNIIRLVGYCYETRRKHFQLNGEFEFAGITERALCFEYMQGGSLEKHISDESCGLDWHACYKIIKGICEGLYYLHTESKDNPIYHLDLKPANVLLDKSMMPKIGDFGLSRLFGDTKTHTATKTIGTIGYMPPEYISRRHISKKFDVFSLGVIIIQIMAGRTGYSKIDDKSPEKFIELVHEKWEKRLHSTSKEVNNLELKTCIQIALRCVAADREKRPTITEIIDKLNELDTVRMSLMDQSSGCKGYLAVDPVELRFPFELNKEISCVMQLTNKTDDSVAFVVKTNRKKYCAQPAEGKMAPWSRCYIIVTMQPQKNAPPNTQCNDVFIVQSRRAGEVITVDNVAEHVKGEVVDDEVKLPIVYVALPRPPSPTC